MLLALALVPALVSPPAKDPLAEAFRNPPASARPHTWWHWMNGNVTEKGLTADLEAMKQVGIGGAQMFTVDQGIPAGQAPYMSPTYRKMVTHAVKEAGRLGIELCIHNCAGWSSSGGPWIKPQNAMQVIAWSTLDVHGGQHFHGALPPIKAPQVYAKVDYAEDIAVYAFPKPTDSKKWDHFLGKTGVIREDGLQVDTTQGPGGAPIPVRMIRELKIDDKGVVDWDAPAGEWTILRVGHVPTGKDNHPAPPEGDGLEVDKLSREALDVHWAGMMAKIIQDVGPLAGKVLNNALIDSYEVGSQNWTPKMFQEFQKRRGYDMKPWLPVIAGFPLESREKSERFLWDLRKTIAELYAENYFGYFGELCHKAGMKFSTEPYGNGGFDCIQSGGKADIPMGEFWIGGLAMETTKLASSVGHVYGRPVIGAESFTADDNRGKWLEEPYGIKALGDQVFCNGINRYIFHRYAAQPWLDLKPGMTMGPWGTHLDRTQTWWIEAQAWMKYIARCQYLLQSGQFVADTLYFSGESPLTDYIYGPVRKPNLPAGFDYDNCDTTILMQLSVKDGKLVLPSGMVYRLLVLPDTKFMTEPVVRKIRELVEAGATVIGPKPAQSPSLTDYPSCDDKVRGQANLVWGDTDGATEHHLGEGRVVWGKTVEEVYGEMKVAPDFEFKGRGTRAKVVTIHRRIGDAEVYFVSNQLYQPSNVDCTFRVDGRQPELWHGDSGEVEDAPVYANKDGRTTVSLDLGPAESVFVVFRRPTSGQHLTSFVSKDVIEAEAKAPKITILKARYEAANGQGADVTEKVAQMVKDGQTEIGATNENFGDPVYNSVKRLVVEYDLDGKRIRKVAPENDTLSLVEMPRVPSDAAYAMERTAKGEVEFTPWKAGRYSYRTSSGDFMDVKADAPQAQDLSTDWHVAFPAGWGAPASVELPKLISWPEHANPGVKYFSGSAVYTKTFDVPASMAGQELQLSLGKVKNFATVKVNGKELPVLWKEPFAVDLTGVLKPGKNRLEIKVTNLWPNRLIGDEQLPEDAKWHGATLDGWPAWLKTGLETGPRPKTGRYTFATWKFWSKDSPLLESGLIGPVVLKAAKKQVIFRP